jgi:hypothetical protein
MAALSQARQTRVTTMAVVSLPIPGSVTVYQGGMACIDIVAGLAKNGAAANANLVRVGTWTVTVDNSASTATAKASVTLDHEIVAGWFDNATGANAVLAADLFSDVYILDDHTVTKASSGNSKAGRVWGVDSTNGVLVESYTL